VRPDPLVRDARLVDAGFGCPRSWIATGCPGINDPGAGLSKCFLRAASFFSTQATKPDYQGVRGVSRVIIVVGAGRPWVTKDTEGHLPRYGGSDCDDGVLRRTDEILWTPDPLRTGRRRDRPRCRRYPIGCATRIRVVALHQDISRSVETENAYCVLRSDLNFQRFTSRQPLDLHAAGRQRKDLGREGVVLGEEVEPLNRSGGGSLGNLRCAKAILTTFEP